MNWKNHPAGVLGSLLLIHLLAHVDRNMLLGFSPQIVADLQISHTQYGFLVGAAWVLSFGVMAVVLGSLADRYSRTRIMAAGVFIWSLCTWASGHARNFEEMALARFFVASGEAALVPAAMSLLAELHSRRRLGSALGVFFMGIPLGVGCSFLLAGTLGANQGWRWTFYALGIAGMAVAALLASLPDRRSDLAPHDRGASLGRQWQTVRDALRSQPALGLLITGFVLLNLLFAGLSFTQLWLVRERGMEAATVATRIGALQLVFGTLGSLAGGLLGDRLAHRLPGGHASVIALLIAVCAVPMVAYRFAVPGSALFYIGMCAGFFLPLATYGSANAAIIGMVPPQTRSTVSGLSMLCINLFAIAIGNLAAGKAVDLLAARGVTQPLTWVVLSTDLLALSAIVLFALAARLGRGQPPALHQTLRHAH